APLGSDTDLRMTLRWTDQPRLENPGALTAAEFAADPSQSAPANLAADARKAIEQWAGAVVVTRRLDGATGRRGDGGKSRRSAGPSLRLAVFGALRDVENPLAFGTILLDRTSGGMRSEVSLPLGGRMTPLLTAGFDAQWARDDRRNLAPGGALVTLDQLDRTREVGPFALARFAPVPGWVVSAGLRYDNVHFDVEDRLLADGDDSGGRTMARLAPSLGVVWARGDGFEPYASVRSSFETPTTTELANQPDGSGGLNPDLGPQTAVHWEAGARGRAARVDWSAALFRAEVEDLLVPFEDPVAPGRRFFRNAGRSRHQGVELGVAWRPAPPLTLRAAYTLADYSYVDYAVDGVRYDGNTVPGIPRHFLVASAEWRFRNGIGAAVEQAVTSRVEADDANSAEADGWTATDLRLWWDGPRGTGLQPFVAVLNLFDRTYAGSVVVNAAGGRFYEPASRRWLVAGVALR
ncbi:MAG TPA: TonB-dependent receptor, partial [Gemmatimonadales bacterium]|nr:TonB-dependent receptor [Gemmatimonadales bacterium]